MYNTVLLNEVKSETDAKPNLLLEIPDLPQDGASVLNGLDQLATVLQDKMSYLFKKN